MDFSYSIKNVNFHRNYSDITSSVEPVFFFNVNLLIHQQMPLNLFNENRPKTSLPK